MQALVLDFDGVLFDSARDTFDVAIRTYSELCPTSKLVPSSGDAPESTALEAFVTLLPLTDRSPDFGVALAAVDEGMTLATQSDFDRFFATRDRAWVERFARRFYEVRRDRTREEQARWLRKIRPYGEIEAVLRRRMGQVAMGIATSRDRTSVLRLLRHHELSSLFPEDHILDKDAAPSKAVQLERLLGMFGLDPPTVTFVDDKVSHLDRVSPLGVRCVLAGWGYNGEREQAAAVARGHTVASLESLESTVFRDD